MDLGGAWEFAFGEEPGELATRAEVEAAGLPIYPCVVPGNFELDLQANGLLPDPFFGLNPLKLRELERMHVWYFRRFSAPAGPEGATPELVFEGLDCLATIYLNGRKVAETDNMLVEHVIPLEGLLARENELVVHIRPAVLEAERFDYPPGVGAGMYWCMESLYIRKAPHMYGWDIMPRAVSAGIWRPVYVRWQPAERIERVYLETTAVAEDHSSARQIVYYETRIAPQPDDRYRIVIDGECGEDRFHESRAVSFQAGHFAFTLARPRLWWPRGYGDAALYDITVTLLKNGQEIDRRVFGHGVRRIELIRTSLTDAEGHGDFCFRVNGERLFVKGTNWVPADAFHSRDAERLPRILEMVADLDCSIVRCWGGNVYEADAFYDWCDAHGVMVWQDFGMACQSYPQDEAFRRKLADEATKVVRRLRQHACLALWSGDNECDSLYADAWYGMAPRDPNTNRLTREVLPEVLRAEDPGRPYLPSSPYIDETAYRTPNRMLPEDHLWGPRDYFKSRFYTTAACHFASEIGYHGCPSPESLREFLSPERLWPYTDNEEWNLHSTAPVDPRDNGRVELMAKQIRALFGAVPDTLDGFAYASQCSQAEAKKFFIEWFRQTKGRRNGIIWWNLMDGWPQLSDAVVDYDFRRKRAYDYIKRSQQRVCLMMAEPIEGRQALVAVNDTREPARVDYRVTDVDTGEELAAGSVALEPNGIARPAALPFDAGRRRCYRIQWTGDHAGWNHYIAAIAPLDLEQYRGWMAKLDR